jgi:hypothetical protein
MVMVFSLSGAAVWFARGNIESYQKS